MCRRSMRMIGRRKKWRVVLMTRRDLGVCEGLNVSMDVMGSGRASIVDLPDVEVRMVACGS